MKRIFANEAESYIGKEIFISGWIKSRRDHGKLLFIDIKDVTGIIQVVILPGTIQEDEKKDLKIETAISIIGEVQKRPEKLINNEIVSGKIELKATQIKYLGKTNDLPFELNQDTISVNETKRLKYRYLDLRSERMQNNLKNRHKINQFIRNYLTNEGFIEIETPLLTKSTPEGARDYIVPSRVFKNKFYALPQSPQQYKQLLMVSSFEKYFQIVRCFRDEDQRADRQPEFSQLDIELSFVNENDILELVEKMIINLVIKLLPNKKITLKPFPRINYDDSIKNYNSDRPDLRKNKNDNNELSFAWVVNFPLFEYKKGDNRWGMAHNPFTSPADEYVSELFKKSPDLKNIKAKQYDLVLNGVEIFGGSIRTVDPKILSRVFELVGNSISETNKNFAHMLEAFNFGVPPHGGIACGLDRLIAILCNQSSIREVIAFPKMADGYDPMMDSPSDISSSQLKELKLRLDENKN